jgi:RNA polymerase sigma-70 factor (ECF subfamily)
MPAGSRWSHLVQRVHHAEPAAVQELYELFAKGIRCLLWRHLGSQDLDDRLHDIFLVVTESIQSGELRDPERLMGFVRTVVRRQVANHIDDVTRARNNYFSAEAMAALRDHGTGPEENALRQERLKFAMSVLHGFPDRDREVLVRFYLREQTAGQICAEMKLTRTQFRLIKSRAKARFGQLGKARLACRAGLPERLAG